MPVKSVKRVDNRAKVAGSAEYIADFPSEGQLHARPVFSDRPHAKILGIDLPDLPSGYTTVGSDNVPGVNGVSLVNSDWPVFADGFVRYVGETVLLLVGPDRERLADLAERTVVLYEDIPSVLTIEDAERDGAPVIFGEDNRQAKYRFTTGDPEAAFAAADRIITGEYRTGAQEHIYLETQGIIAIPEEGGITVRGSMQCPWFIHRAVRQALDWEPERVRVVQATTGGAFGGKEEFPSLIACQAAVAAVTTGRPVRLILDRSDDILSTCKRHPSRIRVRTAHDTNGNPTAMDFDITLDGGAYTGLSPVVLQRTMFVAGGVYRIPNIECRGEVLATNTPVAGAFRGFGGPQGLFAVEAHMERVARELGVPPLEYKQQRLVGTGDKTATGGTYHNTVVLEQILSQVKELSGYDTNYDELIKKTGGPGSKKLRGIGHALVLHGAGFTGSGERDMIRSRVKLRRLEDGRVEILISIVEMGQGLQTTMRKIVARVLDISIDDILYANPDTDRVPDSGPTVASRSIMIVGKLIERAAEEMKERRNEKGEVSVVKNYEHPDCIEWDNDTFVGDAYPDYSWGGVIVQVAIDPVTYELEVEHVWAVHDIGTPIDERVVHGQVEGGILQGLGWASIEVLEQSGGRLRQGTMTDYTIPTSCDAPPIVSELIVNPSPIGPFGAKGAGEVTFVGAPIALASAVNHALGIIVDELPVRPENLLAKMEGER